MKYVLSLSLALALLWLLLSGHTEVLLLAFGALSVGFVVWLCRRMAVVDQESHPIHLTPKLFTYWPWLLKEIVKSNLDVTRRVFGRSSGIAPVVFDAEARQKSDLGLVIHANSITLTPGTVSLEVHPGQIRVHALHPAIAQGLRAGDMDKKVPDAGGVA